MYPNLMISAPRDVATALDTEAKYSNGQLATDGTKIYRYVSVTKTTTALAAGLVVYEKAAGSWDCATEAASGTSKIVVGALQVTNATTAKVWTWVVVRGHLTGLTDPTGTSAGDALSGGTAGVMAKQAAGGQICAIQTADDGTAAYMTCPL